MIRQVCNVYISSPTVRRRLREVNLRNRRSATGPPLTPCHRALRLIFACHHVNWIVNDWKNILFSDESRVNLSSTGRQERVSKRRDERFAQAFSSHRVSFGGG